MQDTEHLPNLSDQELAEEAANVVRNRLCGFWTHERARRVTIAILYEADRRINGDRL